MAAADLRAELRCSIHMEIYKDPVTLPCGHSFCRDCIKQAFDHQEEGEYRCPECQQRFRRRPELVRTHRLHNITKACASSDQEESGIFCTFCDFPVPADKSCLQCETSMCGKHITQHNRTALGHTLLPPSTDLKKRKCSLHKKILEFYCHEDGACICVSCRLDGDHRRHDVEPLDEAAGHKKEMLNSRLETLRAVHEERARKIQCLQERRSRVHEKSATVSRRVTAQFHKVRKELDAIEKKVLGEISQQEEKASLSYTYLIQQLENHQEELAKRICDLERLLSMSDPLSVLQDLDLKKDDDGHHHEKDMETEEDLCVGDLHVGHNLKSLLQNISKIAEGVKKGVFWYRPTDLTLDASTAGNSLCISGDLSTAHVANHKYPESPDRFEFPQVLSREKFHFGQHYWEVETSESGGWRVGVSYCNQARRGRDSLIGDNDQSWCLRRFGNKIYARHNSKDVLIPRTTIRGRLRVYLDCDEGTLCFYELSDSLRHLYTFTAKFPGTLHAAFGLVGWSGEHSWVKGIKRKTWLQLPIMAYSHQPHGNG